MEQYLIFFINYHSIHHCLVFIIIPLSFSLIVCDFHIIYKKKFIFINYLEMVYICGQGQMISDCQVIPIMYLYTETRVVKNVVSVI